MIPAKEHETGFEPATLALARRDSTTEPLVQLWCVSRDARINIHDKPGFVNRFFGLFFNLLFGPFSHLRLSGGTGIMNGNS